MTTPLPFQIPVVRAIADSLRSGRSHMDMSSTGVGKTFMSLFAAKEVSQNIMVIAPISVHNDWKEAAEKIGARVVWIANIEALKRSDKMTATCVRKKTVYAWGPVPADAVLIADEIHRASGQSQYSQIVRDFPNTGRTIMLSATPADSVLRTQALAHVLGLCPAHAWWHWVQKAHGARKGFFGGLQIPKAKDELALETIRGRLRSTGQLTGLIKSQLGDAFPQLQVETKLVPVPNEEEIEAAYIDDLKILKAQAEERDQHAVMFLRSRQMAEFAMVPVIQELIQDLLAEGNRVVVFVNYKATLAALENIDVRYHGDMPFHDRQFSVSSFQGGVAKVFGATASAGGESITLDDQVGDAPRVVIDCPGVSAREVIQCVGRINRAKSKSKALAILLFPDCDSGRRIRTIVANKQERLEALTSADLL